MSDTDTTGMDLGADFLDALDELGGDFLAALETVPGLAAEDPGDRFDLVASLTEEAALSAWIKRAKARYGQVRERNRRALVAQEAKTAGKTYTPQVDGVKIGTITLKGKAREVTVSDPAAFAAWARQFFPTEVTSSVWVNTDDVTDPAAFVAWLLEHAPQPVTAGVTTTVRSSFRTKVLQSLTAAESTTLQWPVDKATGEMRELVVAGVTVEDVAPEARVHQVTFDKKNGGEDAAAAYFRDRGLDALLPGAEEDDAGA